MTIESHWYYHEETAPPRVTQPENYTGAERIFLFLENLAFVVDWQLSITP